MLKTLSLIILFTYSWASPDIRAGEEVHDGDIPYQAFLRIQMSDDPENFKLCTGTLIKPDVVLTSAKCGVK